MKAKLGQSNLHVVFTGIRHFSCGIILKPILMYDQGKDTKYKKTELFCFNHVYGSLIRIDCTKITAKEPIVFFDCILSSHLTLQSTIKGHTKLDSSNLSAIFSYYNFHFSCYSIHKYA